MQPSLTADQILNNLRNNLSKTMQVTVKTKTGKAKKQQEPFGRVLVPGVFGNPEGTYFTLRTDDGQEYRPSLFIKLNDAEAEQIVKLWGPKLGYTKNEQNL